MTNVRSAVTAAADRICEDIVSGRLVPGQRLPEQDLTNELGVSKTVLREAFAKLEADGIIELKKFKGASVRRISLDDILKIMSVASVVACLITEQATANLGSSKNKAIFNKILSEVKDANPGTQREHLDMILRCLRSFEMIANNEYATQVIERLISPLFWQFFIAKVPFREELGTRTKFHLEAMFAAMQEGAIENAQAHMRMIMLADRKVMVDLMQ